jgi:crotonobetainyl-CoA:carnitine CoA-transferase CaiB-like acyl-CoA transferase
MRINRLEDLPADPHLVQTQVFERREHPTEGDYVTLRHPVRFGKSETPFRRHPPRLGADSRVVLEELGVSKAEVDALIASGAVRSAE